MVHFAAIWYDILSCSEYYESNEGKWFILTLLRSVLDDL